MSNASRRIVLAGLVVAVVDFAYVYVLWVLVLQKIGVQRLAQSIATGLLGNYALTGGAATALVGLALHALIAYAWTVGFWLVLRASGTIQRWTYVSTGAAAVGVAYGALIWLAMDLVVLPLSRARPTPVASGIFWLNLVEHMLLVGPPLVLILTNARRST
ncbi:MAG: hypothetical protein ABJD07_11070 [Gemmatimonadaceae bacterium]